MAIIPGELAEMLARTRVIAVVGLSGNPERASYGVAQYLQRQGYRIVPVNPTEAEILGEPCRASLDALESPIDLIDVFRRAEAIPGIVEEMRRAYAGGLKTSGAHAPVLWLQEGIRHPEAEAVARQAGFDVVSDRCLAQIHMAWSAQHR